MVDEENSPDAPPAEPVEEKAQNVKFDAHGKKIIDAGDLEFLSDVPLIVSVELGRLSVTIKDLLQMGIGTVLEMEKLAGEPLEILVNEREVAKGEVVVINEKFGIRLTDIIDPFSGAKN